MNIFLLHEEPDKAAKALCDKHVNKMCLEAVQIANTGLHHADLSDHAFYGATHKKHPWCKFAANSFDHFYFVVRHAQALGREFLRRYDSRHKAHTKLRQNWKYSTLNRLEELLPERTPWHDMWDDMPQAMPDEYKQDDPVLAYRAYYKNDKWTKDWCGYEKVPERKAPPEWLIESPKGRWKDLSG